MSPHPLSLMSNPAGFRLALTCLGVCVLIGRVAGGHRVCLRSIFNTFQAVLYEKIDGLHVAFALPAHHLVFFFCVLL